MTFSVLQWNIDYSEAVEDVAEAIAKINPDVACLQELSPKPVDAGEYIKKQLGMSGFFKYDEMTLPNGNAGALGCGIFTRFPISSQSRIHLGTRSYLQAELKVGEQVITVATTHLPLRPSFRTPGYKKALVEKLLEQTPESNYILAGDFNSTPRSSAVSMLKSRLKHAGPNYKLKTWAKKPFDVAGYHFEGLNWRLDYVFYKGSLRPVESRLIETEVSDHYPILAEFQI